MLNLFFPLVKRGAGNRNWRRNKSAFMVKWWTDSRIFVFWAFTVLDLAASALDLLVNRGSRMRKVGLTEGDEEGNINSFITLRILVLL